MKISDVQEKGTVVSRDSNVNHRITVFRWFGRFVGVVEVFDEGFDGEMMVVGTDIVVGDDQGKVERAIGMPKNPVVVDSWGRRHNGRKL